MKRNKKLAIILSLIIILGSFTGCSQADLGYLKTQESISSIQSMELKGSADITINKEAIESYLGYELDSEVSNMISKNGKISITYDGKFSLQKSLNGSLDLYVNINGKTISLKGFVFTEDGIYISKDALINAFEFMKLIETDKDNLASIEKFQKQISEKFNNTDFIRISDNEEFDPATFEMAMNSKLTGQASNFLQKAFSGYSTGLITPISNGYQLSFTLKDAEGALLKAIDYVLNNQDAFFKAVNEYVDSFDSFLTPEELKSMKEDLAIVFEDKAELTDTLISLKAGVEMFTYEDFSKDFQQSYFTQTVTKNGNEYRQKDEINVIAKGKSLGKLQLDNSLVEKSVAVETPKGKIISMEDASSTMDTIYNEMNPITGVEISWFSDDSYADLFYERKNDDLTWYFNSDYDAIDYKEQNGSLYVPLRDIAEGLGLEVKWDQKAKKAYVIKENNTIEMAGMLIDGTYFIKVRDFEKLNYKIDYSLEDDMNTVTLSIK